MVRFMNSKDCMFFNMAYMNLIASICHLEVQVKANMASSYTSVGPGCIEQQKGSLL